MSRVLLILQFVGLVVLILLILAICLLLLLLLSPIRYRGQFQIKDPLAHEKPQWEHLKECASGGCSFSYLGPLARGSVKVADDITVDLRIAWRHVDLTARNAHGKKEQPEEANKKEQQSGIYDKITRIYRKADYYKRVLQKDETSYTLDKMTRLLRSTVRRLLPRHWEITGTVGLGDPAATARILAAEGILLPVTAGHLSIAPEFSQWQMDLAGSLRGKIRPISMILALLQIIMDRKIRRTISRLRNADKNIARHFEQA